MFKRIIGQDAGPRRSARPSELVELRQFGAGGDNLRGGGASDRGRIVAGKRIGLASRATRATDRAPYV